MGKWIHKQRPKINTHVCENPSTSWGLNTIDIMVGDQYRCSCGLRYELTSITKPTGLDDPDHYTWKRVGGALRQRQSVVEPKEYNEPNDLKCR